MRKSGGIVALIAGLLGLVAAVITLLLGGISSIFNTDAGSTVLGLGWNGVFICFFIIVLGSVAMNAKNFIPGILIVITSIFGVIYGGTLVAISMILAFIGGVLACMNDGNSAMVEIESQDAKSNVLSLIKIVVIAIAILTTTLFLTNPNQNVPEKPTTNVPADTEITETLSADAAVVMPETTKILQNKSLGAYLGNPALEILKDELIQQNSMKLLGHHYDKFIANMEVSSELEMDSNYILGFGCGDNMCLIGQAAFAVNKQTGEMIAVLVTSEGDHLFGVDSVDKLPGNLQSWYLDRKQAP